MINGQLPLLSHCTQECEFTSVALGWGEAFALLYILRPLPRQILNFMGSIKIKFIWSKNIFTPFNKSIALAQCKFFIP
jgi:hypothetical protein